MDQSGNSSGNGPRKMRFKPKAPPKREIKPVLPKVEKAEIDNDEAKKEDLLRRYNEIKSSVRPKFERKAARVTFADGGGSTRNLKQYKFNFKNEGSSYDGVSGERVVKEYKEPWDYYTNYPTTLPIRRPYSGNPELLDEEEFGEDPVRPENVVDVTNAAEELSLWDESLDESMFFLQLPRMLPAISQSNVAESANGSGSGKSQKLSNLESLQEGLIGKMLVYKSGAVKLKLGDTLHDVSPGSTCLFAQELIAVNAEQKFCCNLGELSKRAVATPDIDSMLEDLSKLR